MKQNVLTLLVVTYPAMSNHTKFTLYHFRINAQLVYFMISSLYDCPVYWSAGRPKFKNVCGLQTPKATQEGLEQGSRHGNNNVNVVKVVGRKIHLLHDRKSEFTIKFILILAATKLWTRTLMARQANIILAQDAEKPIDLGAGDIQVFDIEEDKQNPGGEEAVSGLVDPAVRGRTLNGDVATLHDALLARIKDHPEDSLDHDGVVEALNAVHGRHTAWSEIDHAANGSVFDGYARLYDFAG